MLERGDDVGGTWHYNTYPGCACDVPSHLYSFSFAPNPDWTRTYSPPARDPRLPAALRRRVRPPPATIRLSTTVESAAWDDDAGRWTLETAGGPVSARVLVAGMGPLSEPEIPDIPGSTSFEGKVFHSARWDHDYDLHGKRVASIGTGASAIQFVPAIQPDVEQLHVFQRTPPWIMPHTRPPHHRRRAPALPALPGLQKLVRGGRLRRPASCTCSASSSTRRS